MQHIDRTVCPVNQQGKVTGETAGDAAPAVVLLQPKTLTIVLELNRGLKS